MSRILPSADIGLGAAAYQVEQHADWTQFASKLDLWIAAAVAEGARLLVLPEYAGMEAALVGDIPDLDPAAWCARAAQTAPAYADLASDLAKTHGVWLLSGSLPSDVQGALRNRAWFCCPNGRSAPVDKLILTPWERQNTPLSPGTGPTLLDTDLGRIGVLICYDSEFPELSGPIDAEVLLVPSCTETLAGQTRVRNAARARALENQCAVLQAPLVGDVPVCPLIDLNSGRAGVFVPPDEPFPATGILAQTAPDQPGWAIAPLPRGSLSQTRSRGHVAPLAHRSEARMRAARPHVTDLTEEDA